MVWRNAATIVSNWERGRIWIVHGTFISAPDEFLDLAEKTGNYPY
jgi:hypothetical protein